jgi:nitrous oxide reductase
MNGRTFTRRQLLAAAAMTPLCGAFVEVGGATAETVCANPNFGDPDQRKSLHYVEASADPNKTCEGCMYFASQGRCGNCRILSGPVNPAGYCDSWSAKP